MFHISIESKKTAAEKILGSSLIVAGLIETNSRSKHDYKRISRRFVICFREKNSDPGIKPVLSSNVHHLSRSNTNPI